MNELTKNSLTKYIIMKEKCQTPPASGFQMWGFGAGKLWLDFLIDWCLISDITDEINWFF